MVNVSEGFQLRTAYKKKVKPSKLDGLLERRVKQFTLEEKQRLERMKQAASLGSKIAVTKSATSVKTEATVSGKQPSAAAAPSVKVEEKEESPQVKDPAVKKLDFDPKPTDANTEPKKENADVKSENADVKSDPTPPRGKETGAQGNGEEARKEVNGDPVEGENNCVAELPESEEKPQKPEVARVAENAKKRAFEQVDRGAEEQSENAAVQINGKTVSAAESDVRADAGRDGFIEPVKSLMNGNVCPNDVSDKSDSPPCKMPKLENHVAEKGSCGLINKSEDVAVDDEELPAKLPSSCSSLNSTSCKSADGSNTSADAGTTQSKVVSAADASGASAKPAGTSQTTASTTAPPAGAASTVPSQKPKAAALPAPTSASSMTISKEYTTRDRVSLLRFSKSRKARSGTALPSYRKFVTKSSKKSIFILPNDDLKRLARRAGIREVPIFNYNAKPALDIWPYPSPRPTFGITWR